MKKKKHNRHFRFYFKNMHPAYIVDQEGDIYVFHRVTHSKTSGGKKNWEIDPNPIKGHSGKMYIVKKEQRDKRNRFSPYFLIVEEGYDISFPFIKLTKKAGPTQIHLEGERATNATSKNIKTKHQKKRKKKKK